MGRYGVMWSYREVRFHWLSNSPAEEDEGVRVKVKLVMSQAHVHITRGENYMLGCIRNAVRKVR